MENIASKKWESIDFTVYLKFALPWAVLAAVIEILFRMFAHWLGTGFLADYREYIVWVIRLAAVAFICWRKLKIFGSNTVIGAIAGLIFGAVIGFISSIYLLFEGVKVWKIFNIFSETVFLAIVAAAILIVVSTILKNKFKD